MNDNELSLLQDMLKEATAHEDEFELRRDRMDPESINSLDSLLQSHGNHEIVLFIKSRIKKMQEAGL